MRVLHLHLCWVVLLSSYSHGADFLPVSPYEPPQADKAFAEFGFAETWNLEDFETAEIAKRGVTIESTDPWSIKQGFSVESDGEQGFALEARHSSCAASFPRLCPATVTFSFDRSVFDALPSYVGFVWTDAERANEDSAFPYAQVITTNSLGQESSQLINSLLPEDGKKTDDAFIGVVDEAGFSSIRITIVTDGSDVGGHFAVDHFQYGSAAIPGDANVDGQVDFEDFLALAQDFGSRGAGWSGGDFDFDGLTSFPDFLQLSKNYGKPKSTLSAAVPEPSAITLIMLSTLILPFRRWR